MAHRTIQSFILSGIVLLAACGSEPTSAICTRADEGAACSEPTSAEFDEAHLSWRVVLRTTITNRIEYTDGGVLCVLTETRCIVEECNFFGSTLGGDPVAPFETASEAIAACRENFNRD